MSELSAVGATAERFFETLVKAGDRWVTRRELAASIGRASNRLTPYEMAALDLLISQGRIEAERLPWPGGIGVQLVYRAKAR